VGPRSSLLASPPALAAGMKPNDVRFSITRSTSLAALSVGLPIGIGVYFPWVNRDWKPGTKATGFAAAVAAGLVGAWLGFQAANDLLALFTAIVGASVGANLRLILLDVAWDQQARDRFAATNAKETLEARPQPADRYRVTKVASSSPADPRGSQHLAFSGARLPSPQATAAMSRRTRDPRRQGSSAPTARRGRASRPVPGRRRAPSRPS
jgi:uncharacterized membrane protein YeaQ/YmgE (transglycosylase-associated protein family)